MARTAEPDTVAVIQAMHEKLSYRAIAHELGLDHRTWPPTLRRIARGETVSVYKENYVRRALGMEPVTLMVETPACPDCGSVHSAGRCNGKPVTVRLVPRRTPPPAWVREATENLIELMEAKEAVR